MKICTFNVLNLFLNMDKYSGEDISTITEKEWSSISPSFGTIPRNKSLYELTGLATAINDIDADVFILPEVGGKNSLVNFNKYFLSDKYKCIVMEENSNRGIYVGYLVKKEFRYETRSYSNRKITIEGEERRMSRNLTLVSLYKDDVELCHVLGVHLKSQMNFDNPKDVDYMDVREAELKKVVDIYEELSTEFSTPVFIGGDFNYDLMDKNRQESKSLEGCDLVDIHQLKESCARDRITFVYFQSMNDVVVKQQLDFLLFSEKFKDRIEQAESGTYYFKNEYGDSFGIPDNRFEKQLMPSDHFPIFLKLKLD